MTRRWIPSHLVEQFALLLSPEVMEAKQRSRDTAEDQHPQTQDLPCGRSVLPKMFLCLCCTNGNQHMMHNGS